jgi:hypothetical protein
MKIGIRFALATVSIILVVSLAANGYLYFSANNRLSENDSLKKQIVEFQSEVTFLQNQTTNLQRQLDNYQNRFPNLVTALGATFTWSYSATASYGMLHYLYVQGTVTNTGNGTAYNCDLKVIMTTSHGVSYTEYYRFNALAPGEVENVDTHFYHDNLLNWTITPECTNTP